MHVASPFTASTPSDESSLIRPAREGTLRVLHAATSAGVKRIVMTSSFGAIGYGHAPRAAAFDERDWTDLNSPGLSPYIKSKTLAEQAAWQFIAEQKGGPELTVINPVGVFGPVLGPDLCASIQIVQRMLDGKISRCPRLYFGVVDVRDVADLHLLAMTALNAKGERFLAVAGDCLSMLDVAGILRAKLGAAADKAPKREVPDMILRLLSWRNAALRAMLPDLGNIRHSSNEKARQMLGWSPGTNEEAIVASAESLLRLGG
jgi:dihydroflavonol-4-reductase